MNTYKILADKIRAAAFVCIGLRHGYSLSVLDTGMNVIPLPDSTSWEEAMHLVDLCSFEFGPGLHELPAPEELQLGDLSELFAGTTETPVPALLKHSPELTRPASTAPAYGAARAS